MSSEKEIIRKLYVIRDELRGPNNTYAQQQVAEVIELLESEPPAGEFTKKIRKKYLDPRYFFGSPKGDILEACDRIDRLEEKLKAVSKYANHKPDCPVVANHYIGDSYKKCTCGFEQALKEGDK